MINQFILVWVPYMSVSLREIINKHVRGNFGIQTMLGKSVMLGKTETIF